MYIQHEKGWPCRDSYDKKNQEIAPVMMTQWWSISSDDDPDPVMMIQQWWSRSSDDDPDPVTIANDDLDPVMIQIQWWCLMMIQIGWWSRSRDDTDPMTRRWLEDEDDLKMKMTWKWRWLEDSEDLRCRWRDDPVDTEKKTSAKNCVERIPS